MLKKQLQETEKRLAVALREADEARGYEFTD